MIKVSVLYPPSDKFDWDYYLAKHMPLVSDRLGAALKKAEVSKGVAGGAPGAPATYAAICTLSFDSVEAFQKAMGAHAAEIMGDIPNYTDATPVVQISEVKL
ncbi:EthD protein [Variibacter gotjawalensis]|uniref:EthD protein n=1 Tax=Variibacter gotjawalensis TaxID=1333996 RepID=A0A0S3PWM1_9BRAD|nr:EthD family reductase [Variibacter gotjawalensis]NIK46157.1 uncharacterized protein (TIGR02118 family) [Variibacter gotjawalensis]RZS48075.1 uncharacterized protein (TIGR02118 family) [Variibacter gotjawalensis]BAT60331.1 EthD protein [Variibacter gotjawalensis]